MKSLKFKAGAAAVTVLITACLCLPFFTACGSKLPSKKIGADADLLKAEGGLVKNADGETVFLRGVNAGGLFVTEHWMTGFSAVTGLSSDYKTLSTTFIERFGEEKTKQLWAEYRANWWTDVDFKNCADMGMNVIRLPFSYMNVDFGAITDYNNAGNYDFSDLDAFVERAAEYGMYTILDLHGAYGSQNGKDHSGQIENGTVDFYYNAQLKGLTVNLWSALAEHYKDNAAVAGYDILNEPAEHAGETSGIHWDFYDKVYDAIREKDKEHIVIFESCWSGENLPQPSQYGWENCMYSFHEYTSNTDTTESGILSHNLEWNKFVANVTEQNFGVPIQMGEFSSYNSAEKWEYTLDLLNRTNWHWTSWTYKVWSNQKDGATSTVRSPWGIVNVIGTNGNKVNPVTDSYEEITEKFRMLRTDGDSVEKYVFYRSDENGASVESGTLEDIYREYTSVPAYTQKLAEGNYVFNYGSRTLTLDGSVGGIAAVKAGGSEGQVVLSVKYHPAGDGSAYVTANGKTLTVYSNNGKNYITANGSTNDGARFYPVVTDEGVALVSYAVCKYLRVGDDGLLLADASRSEATVFVPADAVYFD